MVSRILPETRCSQNCCSTTFSGATVTLLRCQVSLRVTYRPRPLRRGEAMQSRIPNPALSVPGLLDALQILSKAADDAASQAGLAQTTLELVNLRASQINGCAVCLDMHSRGAKKAGETDERLFTLAAWRDTPYFTDAERAALALTEAGTRLADHGEPVPDVLFDAAAEHYDEGALSALVVCIAAINMWNRLNVLAWQQSGEWTAQLVN